MTEQHIDDAKLQKLREAFRAADSSKDGKLTFEDFFNLLKKGNPDFKEDQAEVLFENCDQDMSGGIDFDEFTDYIFKNHSMDHMFKLEPSADEEECKGILLGMSSEIRGAASAAVRKRGENWRQMSWRERLEEAKHIHKAELEHHEERGDKAPIFDPSSTVKAARKKSDRKGSGVSPKSPMKPSAPDEVKPKTADRRETQNNAAGPGASLLAGSGVKGLKASKMPMQKFAIAEMTQEALVDYSLQEDDLSFAGNDRERLAKLREFRRDLKTAGSPLDHLDVVKYIAKGTAGWVFLCQDKNTGERSAMKMIRMTQARTGIREWLCSIILRGVDENIVFTSEKVTVVDRSQAPQIIQQQLANAGPVNYFVCMSQELMPWGTLEDLAKEGELSPEIMFKCLEDAAQALAKMHAIQIQHRDVKPENIMLQMDDDDVVVAAKLCDFGCAEMGDNPKACWDDIRRFGVTLYSVASGEGWTKNRLIHADHADLVGRMKKHVESSNDPTLKRLPEVLEQILSGNLKMAEVAELMSELADAYED